MPQNTYFLATKVKLTTSLCIYGVSLKKTGPLQLISQHFTNTQHSLIIVGTEIPYSILH